MWLAFLQPKLDNIMLILAFSSWAPNYSLVIEGFDDCRSFLCAKRTNKIVKIFKNFSPLKFSFKLLTLVLCGNWIYVLNPLLYSSIH
ncbi:hypothetical protein SLEP1_g1919 [Rubroshorea leprosula]|uniref:Uncharacterized protein n=1 Tax=Rubroshorea leprosula TaxID=152421 RepID=A0AAV5HP50_9ROSI|nr:hypothetical protein SLEP1_g1919 [Rubroshorea leprosula]